MRSSLKRIVFPLLFSVLAAFLWSDISFCSEPHTSFPLNQNTSRINTKLSYENYESDLFDAINNSSVPLRTKSKLITENSNLEEILPDVDLQIKDKNQDKEANDYFKPYQLRNLNQRNIEEEIIKDENSLDVDVKPEEIRQQIDDSKDVQKEEFKYFKLDSEIIDSEYENKNTQIIKEEEEKEEAEAEKEKEDIQNKLNDTEEKVIPEVKPLEEKPEIKDEDSKSKNTNTNIKKDIDEVIDPELEKHLEEKSKEAFNIPPEVIVNDQKIIFQRLPVFDGDLWLFPLEEIAVRTGDQINVDIATGIITVSRLRDRSVVQLNTRNGVVTVNNRPYRTLLGYQKIVLSEQSQLVPTSAIVILLGLTSKDDDPTKLILNSTSSTTREFVGTVKAKELKGIRNLLTDYLVSTTTLNNFINADLTSQRYQLEGGAHNDDFSVQSNLIVRGGTGTLIPLFDSGYLSFFKRDSITQGYLGDQALSLLRSPLLTGINVRGLIFQSPSKIKDSKFVYGLGLLPSNQKLKGQAESFIEYKRVGQFFEWSKVPSEGLQYSFGEALFHDLKENVFVDGKQTGALLTSSVTKTGKYFDTEANFGVSGNNSDREVTTLSTIATPFGNTKKISSTNKESESGLEPGGDLLLRYKPKSWLSLFGQGQFFGSKFYTLSGNSFYNDRKQISGGTNISFPGFNVNLSHIEGTTKLEEEKPSEYKITNASGSYKPFRWSPILFLSYTKNKSQINSTRQFDQFLNPINDKNISTIPLEDILERRTTDFFRASAFQNFKTFNYNLSYNQFKLNGESNITNELLGATSSDSDSEFKTVDLSLNKKLNRILSIQNFNQASNKFNRATIGFQIGPIIKRKLTLNTNFGFTSPKDGDLIFNYSVNGNLNLNKRFNLNFNYFNADFRKELLAILQYNIIGRQSGTTVIRDPQAFLTVGKIKGRVIILEQELQKPSVDGSIALPPKPIEIGLANARINFANNQIRTDSNGVFEIPSVTKGIQRIELEYSDIPAYLTSITPEIVDVSVEAGRETNVDFILSYYASVKGKVTLVGEPPFGVSPPEDLADIKVYIEGLDSQTLTEPDGSFEIGDIKPGKYKIKIDPKYLIDDLEILEDSIELELRGKQIVEGLELKVKYKSREEAIQEFSNEKDSSIPEDGSEPEEILDKKEEGDLNEK